MKRCTGALGFAEEVGRPGGTVSVVGHHERQLLCDNAVEREGESEDACEIGGDGFVEDIGGGSWRCRESKREEEGEALREDEKRRWKGYAPTAWFSTSYPPTSALSHTASPSTCPWR